MALWLIRAGGHGEDEQKFLENNLIYLTWNYLNRDLSKVESQNSLRQILAEIYRLNGYYNNASERLNYSANLCGTHGIDYREF